MVAMCKKRPVRRIAPLCRRLRCCKPAHRMHHHNISTYFALCRRTDTIVISLELPPAHALQERTPRLSDRVSVIKERSTLCRTIPCRSDNVYPKRSLACRVHIQQSRLRWKFPPTSSNVDIGTRARRQRSVLCLAQTNLLLAFDLTYFRFQPQISEVTTAEEAWHSEYKMHGFELRLNLCQGLKVKPTQYR